MLARFGRVIGLQERGLPLPEILLLGQLAGGAQTVEHRRVARLLIEEAGIEIPQRPVGRVVEGELLVGAEDGDAGGQVVERAPMRLGHAGKIRAHPVRLGDIDADPGAAAAVGKALDREAAPGTRHDGRQPPRIGLRGLLGVQEAGAGRAVEQLDAALDRVGRIPGFDRARIGLVREAEPASRVARPDRRRDAIDQCAQRLGFLDLLMVANQEIAEFVADAAHIAQPQDGAPADRLSVRLDQAIGLRGQHRGKADAARAQRLDRALDHVRLLGIEPAGEDQHMVGGRHVGHQRGIADDLGLLVGRWTRR